MDGDMESSLIAKLQSSNLSHIHQLFSDYLRRFKWPPKSADEVRSLAKNFLPFLNRALSLLPKRLSETPRLDEQSGLELFDTYKLCLYCLKCVSSQLSCKPYSVQIQRVRLIHCFEAWGRFVDAEHEGFLALECLREIESASRGSKSVKKNGQLVPELGNVTVDHDLALLVVEVVVTLVKCVSTNQSKQDEDYRKVLTLVDEVTPWFRVLDANAYEKLHRLLVTYLNKCTLFLVGELTSFNKDLVRGFCLTTFQEYSKSSMKDQMQKFARRICSSLFSLQENESSSIIDLLTLVMDTVASECKIHLESIIMEFLEFVCYCANKCRAATTNVCHALATYLCKIAGDFGELLSPFDLILRLYGMGLFISDCNGQSRQVNSVATRHMKDGSVVGFLLDHEDVLHNLDTVLSRLKSYFHITGKDNRLAISDENKQSKDALGQVHSDIESKVEASGFCKINSEKSHMLYYNGLKFLCQPLAEFVNAARKEIVAETEAASFATQLSSIQDAVHQFCDAFLICHSAFEMENDAFDDCNRTVLSVALASLTISFRTKLYIKESVKFMKQVMAVGWIQANSLKFLFASLYNVGVTLYRNKQVQEASKALKLCCRASWICVSYLCEAFVKKSHTLCGDVSEDSVANFVSEACAKTAFLLDLLYQSDNHSKVTRIVGYSLENWSAAENVFNRLPSPITLVKQWVKMMCKLYKDPDVGCNATTLYSLLSSSPKVSQRSLGKLLEQELLAYNEMSSLNPRLCQKMQMDIIDILLAEVYVTDESCLQKSRILIAKGRELRTRGIEGLHGCIQCLSEAISTMIGMNQLLKQHEKDGETVRQSISACHQLAVAYSMRALCIQEAEPNSKQPFEDFHAATSLWLSPGCCLVDDPLDMVSDPMLSVWYHVFDVLSLKGCTKYHHDMYEVLIRLFKRKNVPLEKCLALLWRYRRLGHALCASPVSEEFITALSQHSGELSNSIDFWISCMDGSTSLEIGFQQSFYFMLTTFSCGACHNEGHGAFQSDIKVDQVKQAALDLTSSVPLSSDSVFLAACLYHDMGERMISNGHLMEALSYAKEAHHLRSKLLQEKFRYSVEQQSETCDDNGEIIQKRCYNLTTFQVYSSVATLLWSCERGSCHLEGSILTPWNVLQCYLESTLQVGIIHELIGNGSEAETLLMWGKNVSCFQGLALFKVAFSTVLGRLYRKKQLWDLAEKELQIAKLTLSDCCTSISCLKCCLLLEVCIDLHLGDLFRSRCDTGTENPSAERLCFAENLYKSALDKLNLSEWKNFESTPEDTGCLNTIVSDALVREVGICASGSFGQARNQANDVPKSRIEAKKSTRTRKSSKPIPQGQCLIVEHNSRITRSRYRSQINNEIISSDIQVGLAKYPKSEHLSDFSDTVSQSVQVSDIKGFAVDSGSKNACSCNKMKCWYCLPIEVIQSKRMNNFLLMKWELVRRQISLRLLTSLGKCLSVHGEIHEAHTIFLQSISVLVSRNASSAYSSVPASFLLEMIGKHIPGDSLTVERAAILYNICWLSLKSYSCKGTRINCCDLTHIQIPRIVSWLMLAFVLCREVPLLLQKVSRLLAAVYVLSASTKLFSPSLLPCKSLSESHFASYFHQASLGTHLNHQLFSSKIDKHKFQNLDVEDSCIGGSSSIGSETHNLLRLAPESLEDFEGYVSRFFQGLPCTTIICLSLLGGVFGGLLTELLDYPSCTHSWILLSRLNPNSQPVAVLLPVDSVLEEASEVDKSSSSGNLFEDKHAVKRWHCPWGSTVIDHVAPDFRRILEENYISSSMHPLEDTKKNRSLWWMQRKSLDQRLGNFLRDLEDSWFGPWKYLLLGELSEHQDSVQKELVHDLKVKCKVTIHESLLKLIVGGANYVCEREEYVLPVILNQGCCIGGVECCNQATSGISSSTCDGGEDLSKRVFRRILEAAHEVQGEESLNRQPIILVLDSDVQMLPWENLPVLRNQEVYRMPSIGSISATLNGCCRSQEQVSRNSVIFPFIDPLDAFYLLNPGGDLTSTQVEFEDWFRDQNLEGKAGTAPTVEELAVALRSHDLFIYFGHGSGQQYIPGHEIQKLENCAATLLMGCSSGSLSLNGSYTPQGAPLCYLLAGSPVVVANLWEVTDKDIDRFGKAMLDSWLRERSNASTDCVHCNSIAEKLKSMHITGTKVNPKKKTSKKKVAEDCVISTSNGCCSHKPRIGSFMGQARGACTLPFLIGASPVCYGVPTGIIKKKDL